MLAYDKAKLLENVFDDSSLETRDLPNVIKNGKAVCVGYVSLFNEYLNRLGYKNCAIESYIDDTSHMYSLVEVNDDKYDIHGIYTFDPRFDSIEKETEDRSISYAFFGRTIQEIKKLKKTRIPRGCSVAIIDGFTDNKSYESFYQEIPLRTMNIINGFFPSEENKQFLQTIYEQGKDKNNWHSLNEKYMFEIAQLGIKARRIENIPLAKIEEIIKNTRQLEKQTTPEEMSKILHFNNLKFREYFDDTRLVFEVMPDNFIREDEYDALITQIREKLSEKNEIEEIILTISFLNNHEQQAIFSMVKVREENVEQLVKGTLKADYNFGRKFLVPVTEEYIKHCEFPVGKIQNPEYFNLNIRNYITTSQNKQSLIIEDADLEFLYSLDKKVKSKKNNQMTKINGILCGENSLSSSNLTKQELSYLKSQINTAKISDFNEYRSKILALLSMKNPEDYLYSSFTLNVDNNTCIHTIERIVNDKKNILLQREFEYDEDFRTKLLEQAIVDYAKICPIDLEKKSDSQATQFSLLSQNNAVLSLNNFDYKYLDYIASEIKKVNPKEFSQQLQSTLKRNGEAGFVNIIIIIFVMVLTIGFVLFITLMYLEIQG